MVRIATAVGALLLMQGALAERPVFTADSLKERMESTAEEQKRAGERLKASRGDLDSLRVLDDEDLAYELPNGKYVPGMLLPNGKLAPALGRGEDQRPACVSKDMKLVPGSYDPNQEAITCKLAREKLAILDQESTAQVSSVSKTDDTDESGSLAKADKYGSDKGKGRGEPANPDPAPPAANPAPAKPAPPANPNIYRPPGRNASSKKGVGAVMAFDEGHFGVPIGTWVEAKLLRRVSSAESGFIEFQTTEDIEGSHQVFPAGTVLFAKKNINTSRRRLESVTVTARLPDGTEVPGVKFRVYSMDKTAGLTGQLIRDRGGEFAAAGKDALLNAAGEVAVRAGDQVTAGVASDIKDDVVSKEKRYSSNGPDAVIEVAPQPVLLQVVQGF
jgi:hypothetical protein